MNSPKTRNWASPPVLRRGAASASTGFVAGGGPGLPGDVRLLAGAPRRATRGGGLGGKFGLWSWVCCDVPKLRTSQSARSLCAYSCYRSFKVFFWRCSHSTEALRKLCYSPLHLKFRRGLGASKRLLHGLQGPPGPGWKAGQAVGRAKNSWSALLVLWRAFQAVLEQAIRRASHPSKPDGQTKVCRCKYRVQQVSVQISQFR